MVHAFAPGATLDVIANFAAAITKGVRESAALHVAVLSISASGAERAFTRGELAAMNAALEQARDQHVTVVCSSGDEGVIPGPPILVHGGLARARATRGVPDVSANADGFGPMAVEWSFGQLRGDTGTSSSAPLWAGVIAFHDVVTGDNSVVTPTGVFTGWGSPNAQYLVPLLARMARG